MAQALGSDSLASAVNYRSLFSWSRAELDQLALRVDRAWRAWHEDWLGSCGAKAVQCDPGSARLLDPGSWRGLGGAGHARAWIESRGRAAVGDVLFGDGAFVHGATPSLSETVALDAWNAATRSLNQALQLQDAQLPGGPQPADLGTWSGAVVAVLPLERGEIRLLLGGEAVAALLPRRPKRPAMPSTPVVPLATAIGSHKLALAAHLSPFDLDLGSLSMLRVGDVIPLPHPLDAPLWVKTADATVCCAFLGQRHGRKAIELVKA